MDNKEKIAGGRTALGIEFGSTRIKAVLIDDEYTVLAQGNHDWENRLEGNCWTYTLDDIWTGIQDAYARLKQDVQEKYGETLTTIGAIGISAMMHGIMAFDRDGELVCPFMTWRNTFTGQASSELSRLFDFAIPQRWTIAHLYQMILNDDPCVVPITYVATLAAYVHWKLTNEKVIGIGDASGIFPIDSQKGDYDLAMVDKFAKTIRDKAYPWDLLDILPEVLPAGADAGSLTEEGAKLLDPSGDLKAGIPLCPPEGDAGTGMVATNSVRQRTGNVSAGTSIFAMVVLERALKKAHPEIDMVTTPDGSPVAMVHCNNCTSDLNAWVGLFDEFAKLSGHEMDKNELFGLLYKNALSGDKDCGGLMAFNYFSGEPITELEEGRPLFMRKPDAKLTLANFMRTHLYSSLATLKIGLDILTRDEGVTADVLMGHGGFFKTPVVGQQIMADATGMQVKVMETAGEGGAWGMAVLAEYMRSGGEDETLPDFLDKRVFANAKGSTLAPDQAGAEGFDRFLEDYKRAVAVEKAAVESY